MVVNCLPAKICLESISSTDKPYDLIVVGGGAAGFFGAIQTGELNSNLRICILEKTTKLLSKVKVSGGGRCNVTHHCFEPTPLAAHYPRGQKELKKLFRRFQAKDTVEWFANKGISLVAETDGRMFPETNDSQTIIDCFLSEAKRLGIEVITQAGVDGLEVLKDHYVLHVANRTFSASKVLIAMGGHPQADAYQWLKSAGHKITPTIPSLFTFNDSSKEFTDLMGVAVPDAEVKIATTSYAQRGPVLITHWGLSGPAVIKLSSWAAEYLHGAGYRFTALVNWTGTQKEEDVRKVLAVERDQHPKRKILGHSMYGLPTRLWERLLHQAEIVQNKCWGEASNKDINRLIEYLIRCPFHIKGKTTFKEEFVTCGGVDLKELDLESMQSKIHPGLYFAGEVLNIDGETGGFNFQSAWTTAFVAARSISQG